MKSKPLSVNVNQIFSLVAFSVSSLLCFAIPAVSQTSAAQSCQSSVMAARERLEAVGNLEVAVRQRDVSTAAYPDYPNERPEEYIFAMKGSALQSVMRSPVLLTDLSTNIIQSCDAVSMVTFAQANSGWHLSFGIFPDDQIKAFECAESYGINPGRGNSGRLRWGLFYCSL
jgi:hypothetical protein